MMSTKPQTNNRELYHLTIIIRVLYIHNGTLHGLVRYKARRKGFENKKVNVDGSMARSWKTV